MKNLVGKSITQTVKFMGESVKIKKLTVAEVLEIQEQAKEAEKSENAGFDLLKRVIKMSVEDAKDLSDDDFKTFPMDELNKLSNDIMKFSGMTAEGK